jgi:simple sugar transport system permease protein
MSRLRDHASGRLPHQDAVAEPGDTTPGPAKLSSKDKARSRPPRRPSLHRLLARPEIGALAGAILVYVFFAMVAGDSGFLTREGTLNWLEVSAELGIIVIPATLLAISGEFDVSLGSMIGLAGMTVALSSVEAGAPLWLAIILTFAAAALIGLANGLLVVRTGLSSLIVTLAGLFILRGLTIAVTRLITGTTQVSGIAAATGDPFYVDLFAGELFGIPVAIYWWIALVAVATWILEKTAFGNAIYAVGGDPVAARNLGVPVNRVKVSLFVVAGLCAALVAIITTLGSDSADVLRGQLKEFQAIAATVIGGTLITGGYGSAIGGALGAVIFGMVSQGIFFTGVDADWFQVFLGSMLLAAVLVNQFVRRRVATR